MMYQLKKIQAYLLEKSLMLLTTLIPHRVLVRDEKIPKNSQDFNIYLLLIELYCLVLSTLRKDKNLLKEFQLRRLVRIFHVAQKSKWWRNYCKKNNFSPTNLVKFSDLRTLPPVTRRDLFPEKREDLLTECLIDMSEIQINSTSGTSTGTPFAVYFKKTTSFLNVAAHYVQTMKEFGFDFNKKRHIDFFVHFNLFGGIKKLTTAPEQFAVPTSLKSDDTNTSHLYEIVSIINTIDGAILFTHPTELLFFVQKIKSLGIKPKIHSCMVIGQSLDVAVREYCEEYMGLKIISVYGFREQMIIATSCADYPDLLHIHSERAFVEILDDNGNNLEDGIEGNITVTNLDNFLMPLIRYQPGDKGKLHNSIKCSCLNKSPLLEIDSRETDFFYFRNGDKKSPNRFFKIFNRRRDFFLKNIEQYQIIQESIDSASLLIKRTSAGMPIEQLKRQLASVIEKSQFFPANFIFVIKEVTHIDDNGTKYKPFIPLKTNFV